MCYQRGCGVREGKQYSLRRLATFVNDGIMASQWKKLQARDHCCHYGLSCLS